MPFSTSGQSTAAESNSPPPVVSQIENTNLQAALAGLLQLQEQLRATQLAIERNRREIKEAVAANGEALSNALQAIQGNFAAQRARDLEVMRESNKTIFVVVGIFAVMGFLTMLMMSYFQWRMSKGLAGIAAALPAVLGLGAGSAKTALGLKEPSDTALLATTEQQKKRIHQPEPALRAGPRLRTPGVLAAQSLISPAASLSFRRRHIRPLTTALIVGLICAAGLALLLYLVAFRKLGLDYIYNLFKS